MALHNTGIPQGRNTLSSGPGSSAVLSACKTLIIMICCSRCFYLLAFLLFFASVNSFGQASCQPAADDNAWMFLQFSSPADETPANADKASCSKQEANAPAKAVKAEGAANAPSANCNPKNCEPCPVGCCGGSPGCCKAKAADAGEQNTKTAKAALPARTHP